MLKIVSRFFEDYTWIRFITLLLVLLFMWKSINKYVYFLMRLTVWSITMGRWMSRTLSSSKRVCIYCLSLTQKLFSLCYPIEFLRIKNIDWKFCHNQCYLFRNFIWKNRAFCFWIKILLKRPRLLHSKSALNIQTMWENKRISSSRCVNTAQ